MPEPASAFTGDVVNDAAPTKPDATAPRRVTSADVARACGVSRATVSYVLNDTPGRKISAQTRELVLKTARELGHVPFAPARSLRLGHSDIVLALVRDFGLGQISSFVLHELGATLATRGYLMLAHEYGPQSLSVPELWKRITPALVVAMGGMSLPDATGVQRNGGEIRFLKTYELIHHSEAGSMQVEYLHGRGHRHIGYAYPGTPSLQAVATQRLAGAAEAADRLGIAPLDLQTLEITDLSGARAALDHWLSQTPPVTAVAAHNDEYALVLVSLLGERGLVAGKDLAVIGVDDIPVARVNITTVALDAARWSAAVIDAVLDCLDGKEPSRRNGIYHTVVRRSSA